MDERRLGSTGLRVTRLGLGLAPSRGMNAVRSRGYALEREEAVIGEAGIAAPIFDRQAAPIGAWPAA